MRERFHAWLGLLGPDAFRGMALLALLITTAADAQTRRALVVGINTYRTPAGATGASSSARGRWSDLEGAVNDARAFASLLQVAHGFKDVRLLLDAQASRQAILAAFRRTFIDEGRAGDIGVFYYAGHGSQVRNSLSSEADKLDETLVPANSSAGAEDIRDKSLRQLAAEAAAKGVRLTLILDSCHSGSMSRGISRVTRMRAMAPDLRRDVKDPSRPPELNALGVLTLTAAQDYQTAAEMRDEEDEAHGVFTAALLSALRSAAPDEPASVVFARTRALMRASGGFQEPALDASHVRAAAPLLGPPVRDGERRLAVAVKRVAGEQVRLQGGSAVGLAPGALLVRAGQPSLRLEVTQVLDVGESVGRILPPQENAGTSPAPVTEGDVFEVERWAVSAAAALPVHLGPALPGEALAAAVRALAPLRGSAAWVWVDDPTLSTPTHVLFWVGEGWSLRGPDGAEVPVGRTPERVRLERLVAGRTRAGTEAPGSRPALYVRLPPSQELAAALARAASAASPLRPVEREGDALYLLAGRLGAGAQAEYAWVLAAPALPAAERPPLPVRTRWQAAPGPAPGEVRRLAGELEEHALRIARVRAWLTFEAAPGGGGFPYRLVLKKDTPEGTPLPVTPGSQVKAGDVLRFYLQAAPEHLKRRWLESRHVYVLGIDSEANISVLYPRSGMNVDNRYPVRSDAAPEGPPTEIQLGDELDGARVAEPLGQDVYVLLTSREPLLDLHALEQRGVMRGEGPVRGRSDVTTLLLNLGRTRGGQGLTVPLSWSVDRVVLTSTP